MSVEVKASCMTTCASETDDGDYETSSEGAMCGPRSKTVTDISPRNSDKTGSEPDVKATALKLKEEKSSDESSDSRETTFPSDLPVKSQSMPMLKSISSSDEEENEEDKIALTSESSLARQKIMKMIVTRIDPLLSSISNLTVSTNTSRAEMVGENFLPKKLESNTMLAVLENVESSSSRCPKGVTFHVPPTDEELAVGEARGGQSNRVNNNPEDLGQSREFDDLIDIAENPHPSINSFYLPPIYEKDNLSCTSRLSSRVVKDLDAISKIDGELRPLRHQLNEIRCKVRALNLTPSLFTQPPYSSQYASSCNISGYYPRSAGTLGREPSAVNCLTRPPRDCGASDHFGNPLFRAAKEKPAPDLPAFPGKNNTNRSLEIGQQNSCSLMNPGRSLSRCVGGNSSTVTNGCPIAEDSYVTIRNFQFGGPVETNPSGLLTPSVSSSYYRCHRYEGYDFHRPHASSRYDATEAVVGYRGYAKRNETRLDFGKSVDQRPQSLVKDENTDEVPQVAESEEREALPLTRKLTRTIITPPTVTASKVHLISINSSVEKHYTDLINPGGSSNCQLTEKQRRYSNKNSESSFETPQTQSVSASLMVLGPDGSSKTRVLNYTRVNSQTSLIVSRKDQSVMTSEVDYSRKKKGLRDLDARDSGYNLEYRQKEIVVRKLVDKSVKASPSEETNKSGKNPRSIQLAKADEKVIIVPIVFIDGVPEPPKGPLFNFKRPRHHVHRSSNHHILKLEKRSSTATQNSLYSGNSAESAAMETYHTRHKLMHRNSEKSMSGVSRTGSCLRCKNPSHLASSTYTDCRHSKGRHSHSSKPHSAPTRRVMKRVIHGMRSSPEDFLCDT